MKGVAIRFVFLWALFALPLGLRAQWTERDSSRLRDTLSGKETIRLNPEFQKAIENGTFLPVEPTGTPMRSSSGELPITMDFSEYIRPDTLLSITRDSLSPVAYEFLRLKPPSRYAVPERAYEVEIPKNREWKEFRIGNVRLAASLRLGNIYSEEVKDGQRRGGVVFTVKAYFSVEELLEAIFWKSARDKKRNRERENTWKYYNDYPSY